MKIEKEKGGKMQILDERASIPTKFFSWPTTKCFLLGSPPTWTYMGEFNMPFSGRISRLAEFFFNTLFQLMIFESKIERRWRLALGVRFRLGSRLMSSLYLSPTLMNPNPNLNLTPTPTLVCLFTFTSPFFFSIL